MKREELLQFLSDYAKKVNTGEASTKDFTDIKNKIRQSYDAGHLDKETMAELGKKASHNFKNMGKTPELQKLVPKILEKGGTVGKLDKAIPESTGGVFKTAGEAAKKAGRGLKSFAPLLGMLGKALPIAGAGAAAMGLGNKAMAGDFAGAGLDAADLAADVALSPTNPVGIAKTIGEATLTSPDAGEGSDIIPKGAKPFDFSAFRTAGNPPQAKQNPEVNDASIAKPNPTRYSDLMKLMSKVKPKE
jgi:hypothetical protein